MVLNQVSNFGAAMVFRMGDYTGTIAGATSRPANIKSLTGFDPDRFIISKEGDVVQRRAVRGNCAFSPSISEGKLAYAVAECTLVDSAGQRISVEITNAVLW